MSLQGEEFMEYLQSQYLPSLLRLSPQQIQDYCMHLQSEPKVFKGYVKVGSFVVDLSINSGGWGRAETPWHGFLLRHL